MPIYSPPPPPLPLFFLSLFPSPQRQAKPSQRCQDLTALSDGLLSFVLLSYFIDCDMHFDFDIHFHFDFDLDFHFHILFSSVFTLVRSSLKAIVVQHARALDDDIRVLIDLVSLLVLAHVVPDAPVPACVDLVDFDDLARINKVDFLSGPPALLSALTMMKSTFKSDKFVLVRVGGEKVPR
ncbi:hypothetical protein M440DRAFT_1391863 [Trichoderma longibrachiatum ATCC 18648]|uniref:Uncharacterized protein n=1 Tax=Trichoderma longibrachiatum ATCC 18648 TaxID=983965 RepID=A0A2T4C453_TRILO|nr:hypothetical protein M440DRAFT_1391863 [Trichoderma longibrachiatum ATCC 18648]